MAITINHGNIAAALGLAALSGQADRNRFVSQQDQEFLKTIEGAQSDADRNYASQIQLALQDKQAAAENALKQQTAANQQASQQQDQANSDRNYNLSVANSQALQANRGTTQDVQQQRLGLEGQHQQTRDEAQGLREDKFGLQQQAIAGLPPELQNIVQSTGRLPYIPNNIGRDNDTSALESEYRRLLAGMQQSQRDQKNSAYDPTNLQRMQQSTTVPGAAVGQEQQYQQAVQQYQALQQRAVQINTALNQKTQSLLDPNAPAGGQNTAAAVLQYFKALGTGNVAQQQAQQGSGNLPVVTTHAQYAALPSGASYINGNTGVTAVKP